MGNKQSNTSYTDLFAWSSGRSNVITISDGVGKKKYLRFFGNAAQTNDSNSIFSRLQEIPNTGLLVSLQSAPLPSKHASMEIFQVSLNNTVKKIYSFSRFKVEALCADIAYNARMGVLGGLSLQNKTGYHLFKVGWNCNTNGYGVTLIRESTFDPKPRLLTSLDFDPCGESIAAISNQGTCLITDVRTNYRIFQPTLGAKISDSNRCRWSTSGGDPILYIKFEHKLLNVMDVEKKTRLLEDSIELEDSYTGYSMWIDCNPTNGNLLASCGSGQNIKIFDRRESRIVKVFGDLHKGCVNCVRWNSSGNMLATASRDSSAKLIDFGTGKTIYTVPDPLSCNNNF